MSSLLVESPVSNSQLYFTWIEDLQGDERMCDNRYGDEAAVQTLPAAGRSTASRENADCCQLLTEDDNHAHLAEAAVENGADGELSKQHCPAFSNEHLEFSFDDGSPRISKPVRMGGVMIQLLKRYGITDQEISEGLARYALKHTQQVAS